MAQKTNKKIKGSHPISDKKVTLVADPVEKIKNKLEKSLTDIKIDHQHLKALFKDNDKKTVKELNDLKKEIDNFKKITQDSLVQLSSFADTSPSEIRDELINGIRLLGERVSSAIKDVNGRIDDFAQQVSDKIEKIADENTAAQEKEKQEPFGSLKEDELFDVEYYEIVPREAVENLTLLFKEQTKAVKKFMEKQEYRIQKVEAKLKQYDDENTRLFELFNKRIARNFKIMLFFLFFILLTVVLLRIF